MDEPTHSQAQPGNSQEQTTGPSSGPQATSHYQEPHHKQLPPKLPPYSFLPQLEGWLEEYLGQKAPQLPERWRQTIAKIGPWVTLVVLILTIPALLALLGFGFAVVSTLGVAVHYGAWSWFIWLLTLGSLVLEIIALPGLFKRTKFGWSFIFYAALLGGVTNILSINIGGLIGTVLSLYIIFQIKNQYK